MSKPASLSELPKELAIIRRATHKTIARVTGDFERYQFNTAIAAIMELTNTLTAFKTLNTPESNAVLREAVETMLTLLQPFTPHLVCELWQMIGRSEPLIDQPWPLPDEKCLVEDEILVVVQVNGKLRGRITVSPGTSDEVVEAKALADEKVASFLGDKPVRKVIVVPGRLVNIVI